MLLQNKINKLKIKIFMFIVLIILNFEFKVTIVINILEQKIFNLYLLNIYINILIIYYIYL